MDFYGSQGRAISEKTLIQELMAIMKHKHSAALTLQNEHLSPVFRWIYGTFVQVFFMVMEFLQGHMHAWTGFKH